MHTITVELKQHTPLLHFQHSQDGATLRASEVKPKLDKFITCNYFKNDFVKCSEFLIGFDKNKTDKLKSKWDNGFRALDYKIKVTSSNFQKIPIPDKPVEKNGKVQTDNIGQQLYTTNKYPDNSPLIMSNIGGRPKCELFNLTMAKSVIVEIITFNSVLANIIIDNLHSFFCKTSFGNRTSKGFGSFEVLSINGKEIEDNYIDTDNYTLSFSMDLGSDYNVGEVYKAVFCIVNAMWKGLKKTAGVKGDAIENVLLGIPGHIQKKPDRIPSPIRYKPYIDFYKGGCDVNIAIFFNREVLNAATGSTNICYYNDIINKNKNYLLKNNIFGFLQKNSVYDIIEDSIEIE